MGSPTSLSMPSTYTEDKIADAIRYAKDLKDRYTVLWLNEQIQ